MFARDWLPVGPFNLYGHQTFFMALDDAENGTAVGVYFHNSNAMGRPEMDIQWWDSVVGFSRFAPVP